MSDYMTQQGLALPPSSRQDIVSALLNDYGNSFDEDTRSPYKMSPVPAFKELPPPPPEDVRARKYSNERASPAFQKMNTPFQLRGAKDAPTSPESPNGSNSSDGSPSRIVSKSIKRRSIPRSLTLTISNGSTAELPSARTNPSQSESQNPFDDRAAEGKALPPPPPEKSTRRQQSATGNPESMVRSPRKDSLHSQDGKDDMTGPVKRKPVPKFTSLAELGTGPRGGKGGRSPQPRPPRQSLEGSEEDRGRAVVRNDNAEPMPRENAPAKVREQAARMEVPRIVNPLPPTPRDEPAAAPPLSSKKPFAGMGLPSNPKHSKGKSDTGFDILKSATSPSAQHQQQILAPQTITPGPTPTPKKSEQMRQEQIVDQARFSPEKPNSQRRPFSFEPVPTSPQLKEATREPPSPINASANDASLPLQTTSPSVSPIEASPPTSHPPRSTSHAPPPPAFASLPSQQQRQQDSPTMSSPESSYDSPSPETPPFIPLTSAPAPVPGAPITHKHHACYSKHATFVWSRNDFQPMACMTCAKNDTERRWACVWCYLRICVECSVELQRTPGRDLKAMMERVGAEVERKGAASGSEYEEEEEEGMHPGFEGGVANAAASANGGADPPRVNGKRHDSGGPNPSFVVWDADAEDVGVGERVDFS